MGLALFDLDRTLLDCNSGRLWVEFELREGRLAWRDAAWAAWWLGRYSLGLGAGLEAVFAQAAATLAGEREEVIRERTRRWFQADVQHRLRPGAARALARHRAAGDHLVLATSGSQYAAECALAAFGLDAAVATSFEVVDGRFTGRIASSALGPAKASLVEAWAEQAGHGLASATFYTDSATDLELLERVGRPVVVHPDRRLAALAKSRGWTVEDWGKSSGTARPLAR